MGKSADRLGRRVSTHYRRIFAPKGTARVWYGQGGEHCKAGFLPIAPLQEIGRLSVPKAKSFIAKRAGVPRVRVGQLYLTFNKTGGAIWWLVTTW